MKVIFITQEALDLIRSKALMPFVSTAKKRPDGTLAVPVDDEVFELISNHWLEGETASDTIIRLIKTNMGRRLS
jgi:hypothetical protein